MCKGAAALGSEEEVETLIFLDIDGVLNVAAKDPGSNPPTFNASNVAHAMNLCKRGPTRELIAEKLLILRDTHRELDNLSYGELMSRSDLDVSDVLVERFAQIVKAAGPRGRVVLCSSWRKPKHVQRVRDLEALVSKHMGYTFAFFDRTSIDSADTNAQQRLVCIGDFLEKYCSAKRPSQLRVMVLEDFLITPVRGWTCGKVPVNSVSDAERYLQSRGLQNSCVTAKLIHTYQEWLAPKSAHYSKPMQMICGVGLGTEHVSDAMGFLGKPTVNAAETVQGPRLVVQQSRPPTWKPATPPPQASKPVTPPTSKPATPPPQEGRPSSKDSLDSLPPMRGTCLPVAALSTLGCKSSLSFGLFRSSATTGKRSVLGSSRGVDTAVK